LQQISLPPTVTGTLSSGILNAQGVIADIGNITTGTGSAATTGTNHALLLLPVQFSVTQSPFSTSHIRSGWDPITPFSLTSTGTLQCPQFQVTAEVNSLGGLVTLDVWQDMHSVRTITYEDDSYTYCETALMSGSNVYLADDVSGMPMTGTDAAGNITCTNLDHPYLAIGSAARPYLLYLQYNAAPRDFAMVRVGSGTQQAISQVSWPVSLAATFTPDPPLSSGTFNSKFAQTFPSYKPEAGSIIYGSVPTATPVPLPRTPTADTYVTGTTNWHQVVTSGTLANEFPSP
jgi:hypothetical protein